MNNEGWVKIHRKFLEWQWYRDNNTKILFLHLLLSANYEEKKWLSYTIERGQVVIGLSSLSEMLGLSFQQIRTSLGKLESTGEITRKTTNKFTIVTICKYDCYQQFDSVNQQAEQQTNNKQITNEQQTNNNNIRNKEIKKERNNKEEIDKSISKKKPKEERELDFRNKVAEIASGLYDQGMIDKFCDYWTESNEGANSKLKFEMQKTFDISRRLATWNNNNKSRFENGFNQRNFTTQAERMQTASDAVRNVFKAIRGEC